MLILLNVFIVTVFRISCEWVEITQNSYRKDPTHKYASDFEKTTKSSSILYTNHSIIRNHWNKGVIDRVTNIDNIKRVHFPTVKAPSNTDLKSDKNLMHKLSSDQEVLKSENKLISINSNTPNLRTYDNVSSEKEVRKQVTNKPVKSHIAPIDESGSSLYHRKIFGHVKEASKSDTEDLTYRSKIISDEINNYRDKTFDQFRRGENTNFQIISNFEKNILPTTEEYENKPVQLTTAKSSDVHKIKQIHKQSLRDKTNKQDNLHSIRQTTTDLWLATTIKNNYYSTFPDTQDEYYAEANKKPAVHTPVTNIDTNNFQGPNNEFLINKGISKEQIEHFSKANTINEGAINGMWKLMSTVSDIIYKNTHRSYKSKINYLENLRSTILTSIEDHINSTWPDDFEGASRHERSAQARGHVEFPSSESALMSISFLTFAVFLIKLVLQVIHTYKSKTMMVTPAVLAAVGRAAAAMKSQK